MVFMILCIMAAAIMIFGVVQVMMEHTSLIIRNYDIITIIILIITILLGIIYLDTDYHYIFILP